MLRARALVVVRLDDQHVQIADDGAQVGCGASYVSVKLKEIAERRVADGPSTSSSVAAAIRDRCARLFRRVWREWIRGFQM